MTAVYRAPMRSRRDDVDPELALERALALAVVGVGGRLARAPVSLAEALSLTEAEHDERTARRLERFAHVPVGSEVWTREPTGFLRRGVVTGPWSYDGSAEAYAADLVHVRPCRWDEPVAEHDAPTAVRAAFERGGRNFQRVRAAG